MITLTESKIRSLNDIHVISLDGEDAKITSKGREYATVKSVSGKERTYPWHYVLSSLQGKKGFNFQMSGSISEANLSDRKQLPMLVKNNTQKIEKITVHKMLELIQFENITIEGRDAKLAIHCRGNTQIAKIIDKKEKTDYYSDWGTVIHVIENKGGNFVKEDMISVQDAVSKGTSIHPKKTEVTQEEISVLCKAEVFLEEEPAVITVVNAQEGCISTLANGQQITRPWDNIHFVVHNREGKFYINQAAHEKKRNTDNNTSSHVSLYQEFGDVITSHKATKEKLAKIINICLEKKQRSVPELQILYLELNKLDLLLELAKSKHAYTQSGTGPWGYGGEWYGEQ